MIILSRDISQWFWQLRCLRTSGHTSRLSPFEYEKCLIIKLMSFPCSSNSLNVFFFSSCDPQSIARRSVFFFASSKSRTTSVHSSLHECCSSSRSRSLGVTIYLDANLRIHRGSESLNRDLLRSTVA